MGLEVMKAGGPPRYPGRECKDREAARENHETTLIETTGRFVRPPEAGASGDGLSGHACLFPPSSALPPPLAWKGTVEWSGRGSVEEIKVMG